MTIAASSVTEAQFTSVAIAIKQPSVDADTIRDQSRESRGCGRARMHAGMADDLQLPISMLPKGVMSCVSDGCTDQIWIGGTVA